MTDARWHQVKALFQATVERPPSERAAFLAAAVGGDEALRREVESLLNSDSSDPGFTDRLPFRETSPAPNLIAEVSASADPTRTRTLLSANASIGPYRVISLLGAGGMGEVFRARDSKLNRDVALKMLPSAFELDPDRLGRFRREAQALAALNHPHIGAIYGLEESNGRPALVLELVEGVTLADRIARGPLPLVEALTIARQIAEALQAAHSQGIIHRDLKPANIKITPANVVKVLDFGLAKTAAADQQPTGVSQSPTVADETRIGVILGTAAYMSPEQARGEEVDARTDIWAFGCVLFEMLAGRKAFAADGTSDSIAKILEGEPDWAALPKSTPSRIRELIRQCLQKQRGMRPRTIDEARAVVEQLLAPGAPYARTSTAFVAAAIIVVSVSAYVWFSVDRPPLASRSGWVQLTNLDSVTQPALSPDGRMLAFIRGPSTFMSPGQLYVKVLPDGEPVALTNDKLTKMGPVFSPDGDRIAYTVNDGGSWDTWEVPLVRGDARLWLRNASGLTWIGPSDLMFSEFKTGTHLGIVRSGENRADSRNLYLPQVEGAMAHRSYVSPDRTRALIVEMDENSLWLPCRLLAIEGGSSKPVGPSKARCTNAAWSPDGRWMYFSADAGDGFHVWRQRFPDGAPEQLTFGPTEQEGLAIARDGHSLITSIGMPQRSVWLRDGSGEHQISLEGYAYFPLLSADGRKVCFRVTREVGTGQTPSELWMVELGSGDNRRLFAGQMVTGYDLSRDDRVVAAVPQPDGRTEVWLAWLDGHELPRRIANADGDNPRFAPDGEILFRVLEGKTGVLYRIRENGDGRAKIMQVNSTVFGTVSPDGEWLSSVGLSNSDVRAFSTSGRSSVPILPYSQTTRLRWSPDGKRVYLSLQDGQASSFGVGRTYVLPLAEGSMLPRIPPGGFRTEAEIAALPGAEVIPYGDVAPGPSPSVYAFSRITTTRNLYRIPLE
jgi:serine/threonine protein kinase/Tol biopolymer transport system component